MENSKYVMNDDGAALLYHYKVYATYERILEHKDHTIFVHDRVYYAFPHGIGTLKWKIEPEYLTEILARLIK